MIRADGIPTYMIEERVQYLTRGCGFRKTSEGGKLTLHAPSVASGSQLVAAADSLRTHGIQATVVGDDLIVDLLWCPSEATAEGRLALIEAFVELARARALANRKNAPRAAQISRSARETYEHLTFAELSASALRHLPTHLHPLGVKIGNFRPL